MSARHYRHQGLALSCNQSLPRLTPTAPKAPDVSIAVLEPGQPPAGALPWVMLAPAQALWRAHTEKGSMLRMRYAREPEWAEFVIDEHGRKVWLGRSERVPLAETTNLLLGPVFTSVLAQRRLTCLHASVVSFGNRTAALVGAPGAGKSTTALALVQQGAALVADDVAVLRERRQRFTVSRGAPRLRLRPDAARALVGSFADLEPMWVGGTGEPASRYLHAPLTPAGDGSDERPLEAVYFLARPGEPDTRPRLGHLPSAEALSRMMANRRLLEVLDRDAHARDFKRLARLTESVPVLELVRPRGLHAIQDTAAAIAAEMRRIG